MPCGCAGIANSSSEASPSRLVSRALRVLAEVLDLRRHPTRGTSLCTDIAESTGPKAITTSRSSTATENSCPRRESGTTPPTGFAELTALLTEAGDTAEDPIPVAIETPRGLLVAALRVTSRPVYAINPMAVARYRERHSMTRAKSDHVDAMTLANIIRVDSEFHRRMPVDSEFVQAIAVLARAQQDAVWRRTKASNELRSLLREYYPAFLSTFAGRSATNLARPAARAVLALAPTPTHAARLTKTRVAAALRRAGRQRGIDALAVEILHGLREPQLHQPAPVGQAMGHQALALLATLEAARTGAHDLEHATAEEFRKHPDYAVVTSFPGLADLTGARVLAEIGDDRTRFTNDRALKAYAGSAPATRASGRRSPSPIDASRTTVSPRPDGSGPSPRLPTKARPAITICAGGHTATATRPRCGTCSTRCSASCTTASQPANPSIR